MTDLRQRLTEANLTAHVEVGEYVRKADAEQAADTALAVFAEWLRERLDAAKSEPPVPPYKCRCGRATVVSERNGRIAALGALLAELDPPKGD